MALGFVASTTEDDSESNGSSVGTVVELIKLLLTVSAGITSGIG